MRIVRALTLNILATSSGVSKFPIPIAPPFLLDDFRRKDKETKKNEKLRRFAQDFSFFESVHILYCFNAVHQITLISLYVHYILSGVTAQWFF